MKNSALNQINPHKLLSSKWTATQPVNKEKHFIVTKVNKNEEQVVTSCLIEAVINNREYEIEWQSLKSSNIWLPGWQ